MQRTCSTEVSLYFIVVRENANAFVPSEHDFKILTRCKPSSFFRGQCCVPMDNFSAPIKSGITIRLFENQFLHACCVYNRPRSAWPTGAMTIMEVCSTIFWQAALSVHHYHTPLTTGREFRCWKCFRDNNRITLQNSSGDQVSSVVIIAHELLPWTASDGLPL